MRACPRCRHTTAHRTLLAAGLLATFAALGHAYSPTATSTRLRLAPAAGDSAPVASALGCAAPGAPAFRVRLPAHAGVAEARWQPVSTEGWKADWGLIFLLQPDGSSRYVDLALLDPATGEAFRYGISTRDPSCHEVFVPFRLLTDRGKSFDPASHPRVSLSFDAQSRLDAELAFTAGAFALGTLNPGEFAWPASAPPFVGTPVYLEDFDGAPREHPAGEAHTELVGGPPGLGIERSLRITLPSTTAEVGWDFPTIRRWPYFDGMSVWFAGEGSPNRFDLVLSARRAGRPEAVTYRHDLSTDGKGWQVEHIEWDDFTDADGKPFEPDEFAAVTLIVRPSAATQGPLTVRIGPFRLDDE